MGGREDPTSPDRPAGSARTGIAQPVAPPSGGGAGTSRRTLFIVAGLVAATILVYGQTWHHAFLRYDDSGYVTDNTRIRGGLTPEGVAWAFGAVHGGNWHPLTTLSHMLDCELFGLHPGPPHLINVLLHAATAALLFLALQGMTSRAWPSAFVAALFALHPLHVESVAWISERKDVLSGLLWMATLLAYIRYTDRRGLGSYSLVVLCMALGLLAKPMLVTLPFVLLLLDWWPLKRLAPGRPGSTVPRLIIEKLPLLLLSAVSSVVTLRVQAAALAGPQALPLMDRMSNAVRAYWAYLGDMLWPAGLAAFYPLIEAPAIGVAIFGALALAGVTLAAFLLRARFPYMLVGWLWYLGTLVPVIGLVQVGEQARADRYTYIPLIGIFVALVWAAANWKISRVPAACVAGAILLALGIGSGIQAARWRNDVTLFQHTTGVTRNNYVALTALGGALIEAGRPDDALPLLRSALAIRPHYSTAHAALGALLAHRGELDAALPHFLEALRAEPGDPDMRYNVGRAFVQLGEPQRGVPHLLEALRLDPMHIGAHDALARAYMMEQRYEEALPQWSWLARTLPDDPRAARGLAVVLNALGRVDRAIAEASRALALSEAQGNRELAARLRRQLQSYREPR